MTLFKYEVLNTVIKLGSITKAAEALNLTQSGISHAISSLEAEMGFVLLAKSRLGIRLTGDGERIMASIRQVLAQNEIVKQQVALIKGFELGTVSIGTFSSVSMQWLPEIIKDFKNSHPTIEIQLLEGTYETIQKLIDDCQVDFGFIPPFSYVLANSESNARVVLSALRKDGSATYKAQYVVRTDSEIDSLEDLAGKKIAFVDPASTSGYLYPAAQLIGLGYDIDKDFQTIYAGGHDKALQAVLNGDVDMAVMFADALSKGIPFDVEKAFEGMKNSVLNETMIPWRRAPKTELDDFYHKNGWFPALHPGEKETVSIVSDFEQRNAVAVTQAASYDDWSIAQMAKYLQKEEDYNFFLNRAFNYRNLFNKETGFFHPKDKNGAFIEPFDYIFSGGIGARAYYDENNAWTYIWDVRHNVSDLIDLFGGNQPFIDKLDQLFVEDLKLPKWQYYAVHPDATGNVGQFVMGNEPSFHIPYLYNYAGQPWKTQKRIRMLLESWFRNDLMGIPGDEDGGGMTAFVVFSQLGFYPVTPGIPVYTIGSPIFTKSTINLDNGKKFTVEAKNASWSNKYIQSATLNGEVLNRTWFTHDDLISGGVLVLEMGDRPNKEWGVDSPPPSATDMQ